MKKYLIIGSVFFLIGCGTTQQSEPQKPTETVKKVVETAKKVIDPCERDKIACLAKCKIDYQSDNIKLKACVAKCYTIYGGCKTAQAAKKGYQKTKEFIQEKINN